jgi:pimeloyl-ACP methyl ester carboxylesterase
VRAPTRARRLAGVLSCLALLASACGNASQEGLAHAVAGSVPVTFRSSDGVELAGRLFGDETRTRTGIVFAHMRPADQSSWFAFADRVGSEGYLALTFDFRGYCPGGDAGCSEGEKDVSAEPTDLAAAVAFLRSRGVETVALVGASMGGTAALVVAADQGDRIAVVITLSAPQSIEGLVAGPDVLARVSAAKLFVAGSGDGTAAAAAQAFFDQAQSPGRVEIVTTDDHGTDLVTGGQAEIVRNLLLSELAQYAPA